MSKIILLGLSIQLIWFLERRQRNDPVIQDEVNQRVKSWNDDQFSFDWLIV